MKAVFAAEQRRDDAAGGGADREHRAPERAAERVGGGQVLRIDHVGQRRRRRGIEDGGEDRQRGEQHVGEPQVVGAHQQERRADHRARQIAGDHQPASVQAVGEPPRPRGRQEHGDLLREDHESDRRGLARRLQQEPAERHEQEPVAAERDHRGHEQPTEVAVALQEVDRGASAGRRARPGFRSWGARLPATPIEEGLHAAAPDVVPTGGVPMARRRAHDLHRPVGHAGGCAARRRHLDHARAPRPFPAGGDRATVDGGNARVRAPRCRGRADRQRHARRAGRHLRG